MSEKEKHDFVNTANVDICNTGDCEEVLLTTDHRFPISFHFLLDFTSLKDLSITHGTLFEFPLVITRLYFLNSLNFSFNNILELPFEIGCLVNLKHFNCNFNQIRKVPSSIGRLTDLEFLKLSKNNISQLPSNLGFLQKLNVLDVSYNSLTCLPDRIPLSRNLKILNARNNSLKMIPDSLRNCCNLVECDFSHNFLAEVPVWSMTLPNLKHLNLCENMINHVNMREITESTQLEFLGLTKNLLMMNKSLDFKSFCKLRVLELGNIGRLHWTFNSMKTWDNSLLALTSLEHLDCSGVGLRQLPESLDRLELLKWLDLGFNDLHSLPAGISNLKNLSYLDVSHNVIECLPDQFGLLCSLEKLFLRHNKLVKLPDSFKCLSLLRICDLSHNEFLEVPDVLQNLDAIEYLDVFKNCFQVNPRSWSTKMLPAILRSNGWKLFLGENQEESRDGNEMSFAKEHEFSGSDEFDTSHADTSSDNLEALTADTETYETVSNNKLMAPVQDDWDNANCFGSAASLRFQPPFQSELHNSGVRCDPASTKCPQDATSFSSQMWETKGMSLRIQPHLGNLPPSKKVPSFAIVEGQFNDL